MSINKKSVAVEMKEYQERVAKRYETKVKVLKSTDMLMLAIFLQPFMLGGYKLLDNVKSFNDLLSLNTLLGLLSVLIPALVFFNERTVGEFDGVNYVSFKGSILNETVRFIVVNSVLFVLPALILSRNIGLSGVLVVLSLVVLIEVLLKINSVRKLISVSVKPLRKAVENAVYNVFDSIQD